MVKTCGGKDKMIQHWMKMGRSQTVALMALARPQSLLCLGLFLLLTKVRWQTVAWNMGL